MFLQETYEVMDTIKYDNGTSSDHNDIWTSSRGTLNRASEYTSLEISSGESYQMTYLNLTNTDNFIIEFDAMFDCTDSNNAEIQFRNSSWTILRTYKLSSYTKDTWTNIRFEFQDGYIKKFINGVQEGNALAITGVGMFLLQRYTDDNYIYFKNFKYYPI